MLETQLIPAEDKTSRRLLIVLHGLGDSMEGYRWLPSALQLPWLNYLLVNAPDGYYAGFSWFDISENRTSGIRRSRKLLFELLEDLRAKDFPTAETMFFGFSQGCVMSIEVGLRFPEKLAGVVAISGWPHEPEVLLNELSPLAREQRFLITHGTQDTLVPFNEVKDAVKKLKDANLQIDWREFQKPHTIIEEELQVIRQFICASFGA
jgi:phospholipase/carboxylesterase